MYRLVGIENGDSYLANWQGSSLSCLENQVSLCAIGEPQPTEGGRTMGQVFLISSNTTGTVGFQNPFYLHGVISPDVVSQAIVPPAVDPFAGVSKFGLATSLVLKNPADGELRLFVSSATPGSGWVFEFVARPNVVSHLYSDDMWRLVTVISLDAYAPVAGPVQFGTALAAGKWDSPAASELSQFVAVGAPTMMPNGQGAVFVFQLDDWPSNWYDGKPPLAMKRLGLPASLEPGSILSKLGSSVCVSLEGTGKLMASAPASTSQRQSSDPVNTGAVCLWDFHGVEFRNVNLAPVSCVFSKRTSTEPLVSGQISLAIPPPTGFRDQRTFAFATFPSDANRIFVLSNDDKSRFDGLPTLAETILENKGLRFLSSVVAHPTNPDLLFVVGKSDAGQLLAPEIWRGNLVSSEKGASGSSWARRQQLTEVQPSLASCREAHAQFLRDGNLVVVCGKHIHLYRWDASVTGSPTPVPAAIDDTTTAPTPAPTLPDQALPPSPTASNANTEPLIVTQGVTDALGASVDANSPTQQPSMVVVPGPMTLSPTTNASPSFPVAVVAGVGGGGLCVCILLFVLCLFKRKRGTRSQQGSFDHHRGRKQGTEMEKQRLGGSAGARRSRRATRRATLGDDGGGGGGGSGRRSRTRTLSRSAGQPSTNSRSRSRAASRTAAQLSPSSSSPPSTSSLSSSSVPKYNQLSLKPLTGGTETYELAPLKRNEQVDSGGGGNENNSGYRLKLAVNGGNAEDGYMPGPVVPNSSLDYGQGTPLPPPNYIGERRGLFKCPICPSSYELEDDLSHHMVKRHTEKLANDNNFNNNNNNSSNGYSPGPNKNHDGYGGTPLPPPMYVGERRGLFQCPVCPSSYELEDDLAHHMIKRHTNV